jgi:hypothetical protein
MAKRVFSVPTITMGATPDGLLTTSQYMAITGGSSTQMLNVIEIMMGGLSSSSTVNLMTFARSSTAGITPTALSAPNADGPMNGATVALAAPPVTYIAASTQPNRSPTSAFARLQMGFNSFGGVIRWVAAPGEEWTIIGTAVNVSESTLSAYSGGGGGAMSAQIVYEPF